MKKISRREFNRYVGLGALTGCASEGNSQLFSQTQKRTRGAPRGKSAISIRRFLGKLTYRRKEIDIFLNPNQPNWARFDPELGYLHRNCVLKDGVDGCRTILSFQKTGGRTMVNYAGRACRVNTYGNSFTEGAQVSDGETWQEYLAAHLGESVRNFGVGGFGVYQAYRRILREEATPSAAEYIILNIWGIDDHLRSIDSWRWLRFGEWWRGRSGSLYRFHGNPWAHVRLDKNTGKAVELDNPYATLQSLYKLSDQEYVYEHFKNDLVVQLLVAQRNGIGVNLQELEALAGTLRIEADFSSPEATAQTAHALHVEYALRTSVYIVEKLNSFTRKNSKKLMILLSYDSGSVRRACEGQPRPDQGFVNFLKDKKIPFVDVLAKHVEDFRSFSLSPSEYVKRYYIGHYKPQGNHFFAFEIKDALVNWLDPKPRAYREGSETIPPPSDPF